MRSILTLLLLTLATPAFATDGVLEINQTCVATGCFPLDDPGFPVTVSRAGAYKLTSDLTQTTFASDAVDVIFIDASNVSLDLNGFTISCVNVLGGDCTGIGVSGISTGFGSGDRSNIHVRNGAIRDMPSNGIALLANQVVIEKMRIFDNGFTGIFLRNNVNITTGALISGCIVQNNGGRGISTGRDTLISGSIVSDTVAIQGPSGGASSVGYTQSVISGSVTNATDLGATL